MPIPGPTQIATLPSGCWVWVGPGHPSIRISSVEHGVARLLYRVCCGPLAQGQQLRQTCTQLGCVNPYHYEYQP
jgi:hypothetical protein